MRNAVGLAFLACVACGDQAVPIGGSYAVYAITHQGLPVDFVQASAYGVDLDGDGYTDNSLGQDFILLREQGLADPQVATDMAMPQLAFAVQEPARGLNQSYIKTFAGPAGVYDPSSVNENALPATVDGVLVQAGPGDVAVTIAPFGMAVPIVLHDARVQAYASSDELHAVIAGALDRAVVLGALVASWQFALNAAVTRQCSLTQGCGCPADSTAQISLNFFDHDGDCIITLDELRDHPLVQQATQPDVTLDGQSFISFAFEVDGRFVTQR